MSGHKSRRSAAQTSGGAASNLTALKAARDARTEGDVRRDGVDGLRLVLYASSEAHATIAELFTDEAITQIHQAARGKPRTVNNICTAALIATAGAGKNLVDHASARAAIAEVTATD